MLNYLALMGWAMPDEREEFTLEEFVAGVHARAHLARRAGLRPREADVAERQVPAAALAARSCSARLRVRAALRRAPPRGAAARAGADRHARGLLRVRVLLLRRRGRLRRGGASKAMVPKGRTAGRDREGAAGAARGGGRPAPRLERRRRVEAALRALRREERAGPPNELFMAVRVAVTGRAASPPLFETLAVLGKETCRRRLRRAADVAEDWSRGPMSDRQRPPPASASGPTSSARSSPRTCGAASTRPSSPASRPSRTATSTSATPSRSA